MRARKLTEAEWKALLGARRQLETAAGKSAGMAPKALAESGLFPDFGGGLLRRAEEPRFYAEELEGRLRLRGKVCVRGW